MGRPAMMQCRVGYDGIERPIWKWERVAIAVSKRPAIWEGWAAESQVQQRDIRKAQVLKDLEIVVFSPDNKDPRVLVRYPRLHGFRVKRNSGIESRVG